jgi:hypothetical protein
MKRKLPNSLQRERFACTLAHRTPDRVPMDLASTDMTDIDGGPRRLASLLGITASASGAETDEAVLRALDTDIRGVGGILQPAGTLARQVSATEMVDMWGIGYRFNGHHYEAVNRPLEGATLDALEAYSWPDPDRLDPAAIEGIRERARFLHEQTPYMEPDRLKQAFGDRLTFYGGVDTQHLLPRGTIAEVERATRELIRTLGASGGYILSAAHTLQGDVPNDNILAFYRAGGGGKASAAWEGI